MFLASKSYTRFSMSKLIIGIDEAGRGAWAGPIVAAAVLYRSFSGEKAILAKVKDSKSLSPATRQELFRLIDRYFIWSVAALSNKFIDKKGIQAANVEVMEKALHLICYRYNIYPDEVRADYVGGAKKYLSKDLKISFYKHGDSLFPEISAASIIAKVYRDRLMLRYHRQYPIYNFKKHKGYGTREHKDCLVKYGFCPGHRRSFLIKGLSPLVSPSY